MVKKATTAYLEHALDLIYEKKLDLTILVNRRSAILFFDSAKDCIVIEIKKLSLKELDMLNLIFSEATIIKHQVSLPGFGDYLRKKDLKDLFNSNPDLEFDDDEEGDDNYYGGV